MSKFIRFSSKLTLSILASFFLFSCSKDADLLSEYVIKTDDSQLEISLLINDTFFMNEGQTTILMDVLNNDNLSSNSTVTIIETSNPINGVVTINDDNTLTYKAGADTEEESTPAEETTAEEETTPEEETAPAEETTPGEETTPEEDTFTYTAEVVNEETGEVTEQEATVTVSVNNSEMGELKAFPGAEGFGKYTTGGRGGYIYHVTNLNNDGSGSLRYGMETLSGKRTIVFDISGYINIDTPLKIRPGHGDITIAGQTAPGEGVSIKGASIWVLTSNVILRYLKVRPGENAYNPTGLSPSHPDYEPDDGIKIVAYSGDSLENIIVDHCTITWAHDGLIDIGAPNSDFNTYARNITIQNCLLGENIDKNYGVLVQRAYDVSFYRNILAFTLDRNIAIQSAEGKGVEMVNNLVYGTSRAAWYIQGNVVDFIGNRFISGPLNREYETFRMELGPHDYNINNSKIYINDNFDDSEIADKSYNNTAVPYIVSTKNFNTELPIISQSELENSLIDYVGDNLHYDSSDIRMMNSIKNRTGGIVSHENNVGGYPNLDSQSRNDNYDSDRDGLADTWEVAVFGDLSKKPEEDTNDNGYTNLDEFLFYLTK